MEPSQHPPRIAVLDDDESVLRALDRLLRSAGYQVSTYSRGNDLLLAMRSSRPDCLLLDVHVPGATGFDVLREARASHPDVAAIVITGLDDEDVRSRSLGLGVFARFRKPFDNAALLQAVAASIADSPDTRAPGTDANP